MKYLALALINFYQNYLSPYKGFSCAHSALNKGDSCSQAIKKIIIKHGLWRSYPLIKNRFKDCKTAYKQLLDNKNKRRNKDKNGKWYDCCDPSAACDVSNCIPKKGCELPDFPCDCSLF